MKIIQIASSCPSHFLSSGKGDVERIMLDDWYAQDSIKVKKFAPKLKVECWVPEKTFRQEKIQIYSGVKFRIFPCEIAIRPGMDLSLKMIKALLEEQKQAENNKENLILHFHEYHSWVAYSLLLFKNKKTKAVGQHHGGRAPIKNLMKYPRLFLFSPVVALMQFCENLLFKRFDILYAFGDSEEGYLRNLNKNAKIKFLTMGIEDEYFEKKDKLKAKKILGLDLSKKYFLYLGRIKTTKGIKELLDAAKSLEKEKIEILLIGSGQDAEKYKKYSLRNRINNVKFLGPIYSEKKLLYLDACDCLILPSYTEGAPVVIMEALAKNLPIIATDVGGVKKMIEDGKNGWIIQPRSIKDIEKAIVKFLSWKPRDVRKSAEVYRWKNVITKTIEDYSFLQKK